ncbi:hypothetical protein IQ13_3771 [Lacibacter cauensis]|uniref:UbiA prenyltransferase family protein n=1 Tax=Lacibacter cauensis TaxID=510947 RepID=A0A562SDK6_9BACT|nr:hypothetical protein [Lacibacter cauensis]TWI79367.1 hypothetical protein IQ13_3771 [Lacibacter cauensis]
MNRLFRFLLFEHLVIAISAAALCAQTKLFYSIFDYPLTLIAFVFFATLLSYNMHFSFAANKSSSSEQLQWFRDNRTHALVFNVLSLAATLWFWWKVRRINVHIVAAILFNAAYTAPLLLKNPIKLPSVLTFIKSYFIGFVWAYATVVLPLAFFDIEPNINEIFLFISRLLLVALATMIFDYRDRLRDFEMGVHTPANIMNEQQFEIFFIINVLLYSFSVVFLAIRFSTYLHLLQLIPGLVALYLLRISKREDSDYFYLIWVDGLLILSPFLSLFLL